MDVFCKFEYISPSVGNLISIRSDAGSSTPSSSAPSALLSGIMCSVNDMSTEMIFESALNPSYQSILGINTNQENCHYVDSSVPATTILLPTGVYPTWIPNYGLDPIP
jgi:hypothetical protein